MRMTKDNCIGKKFGRLTVVSIESIASNGTPFLRCKCDCGTETVVFAPMLTREKTNKYNFPLGELSCGCTNNVVGNGAKTKLFDEWASMICRCYHTDANIYKKYGAKGVRVCDEWIYSFRSFETWALDNGWYYDADAARKDMLTIDRIDSTKGYSPDNCKWSTYAEQNVHLSLARTNTSGIIGVSWSKYEKKWLTNISINDKTYRIGSFSTKREAALARNKYIDEHNLPHQKSIVPEE